MLDFNSSSTESGRLEALIDIGLQQARAAEPRRTYLGASRLGVACSRALQYEYADAPVDPGRDTNGCWFPPKTDPGFSFKTDPPGLR